MIWRRIITWISGSGEGELLVAELEEEFEEIRRSRGIGAARAWYRAQVLRSVWPVLRLRCGGVASDPANLRKGDPLMERLWRELVQSIRSLRRTPGFAAVVIVTLALGIGANASIYSVVNGLVRHAISFPNADRLVVAWEQMPAHDRDPHMYASPPNYADWAAQSRSFEQMAAFMLRDQFLVLPDVTIRIHGTAVSGNMLATLGVRPLRGRGITPDDDVPGAAPVAMISERLWRAQFGGRDDIIGSEIMLATGPASVVGVIPGSLEFPPPIDLENKLLPPRSDIWVPFRMNYLEAGRNNHYMTVIGLLQPGVDIEQAGQELRGIAANLSQAYPESNEGWGTLLVPIDHAVLGELGQALNVLLWAVGLVLLIACVNVANLLLSRSETRQQEYSIRSALGASRWPLLRQALMESQVLALSGGVLGLALAWLGTGALVRLAPANVPNLDHVRVDGFVVAFTFALTLLTGLLFGVAPALRALRANTRTVLAAAGRSSGSRRDARIRGTLVVVEVAMAVVLLAGAGLLLRSFSALSAVETGMDERNVLTARVNLSPTLYPDAHRVRAAYAELEQRLNGIPGVEAAGFSFNVPLASEYQGTDAIIEGEPAYGPEVNRTTLFTSVTPGFFDAAGIRTFEGRTITAGDDSTATPVVVVNRAFVRKFFPRGDAIGNRMLWGERSSMIVGVVDDVKLETLSETAPPVVYFAHAQGSSYRSMSAVVRAALPAEALTTAVRDQIRAFDAGIPMFEVNTLEAVLASSLSGPRFSAVLLLAFAALAVTLAAIGIYGVLSYTVARQRREIGVRLALGARPDDEIRRVLTSGLRLATYGLVIGIVGALVSGRLLRSLLFGVQPNDALTLGGVALTLLVVATAACTLPALRASRSDPVSVLRGD